MANENQPSLQSTYAGRCKNFNGLYQQHCKAGVAYDSVIDTSHTPEYKLPCLKADNCSERCAQTQYPTPEEMQARIIQVQARGVQIENRLRSGQCPHCGAHMTSQKIVHGCAYALPCSCRIGVVAK